jgi:hypothetical protein
MVRIVRQQSLVNEPASVYARTPGKMSLDPASPETPNM